MKRILLVTRPIAPPWDEASKNFAYNLARSVDGFEFGLLTNGFVPSLPKKIIQVPVYTSDSLTWLQRARLLKLRRERKQFDILHFMLTPTKLNAFAFKKFIRNDGIKTLQTVATLREDLYAEADYQQILFADRIVTYSDYARQKLEALGFKNVRRVYPGLDLEYYAPRPKNPEALQKLNLHADDFIVTFPGEYVRLNAADDIAELVIRHAAAWKEKKIKFIFACRLKDGRDILKKEEIMKKIARQGLSDLAVFINTYADMAELYNLSDVIIFPVRDMRGKFDVPLAAIEPLACAKPVILSDLPILAEFAKPEHSVIIERGNVEQLKNALLDLYAHPDKRSALGLAGRKFCEANFDIRKIAGLYAQIYGEL